jgi:hypothetical protein
MYRIVEGEIRAVPAEERSAGFRGSVARKILGGVANLTLPVLAPDAVGFLLRVPSIAPISAVAPLGSRVFGLLRFVANSAVGLAAIGNAVDSDNFIGLLEEHAMVAGTESKEALLRTAA